jgi:hypothetical protein
VTLPEKVEQPEVRAAFPATPAQSTYGAIERVSIGRADNGLEIEIVGEIAKLVELGFEPETKRQTR